MPKFEFQLLCEHCQIENGDDPCAIQFESLVEQGFNKKNIKRKFHSATHCVSATIKLTKGEDEEEIATAILKSPFNGIKQVIINPKMF